MKRKMAKTDSLAAKTDFWRCKQKIFRFERRVKKPTDQLQKLYSPHLDSDELMVWGVITAIITDIKDAFFPAFMIRYWKYQATVFPQASD